MGTALVEQLLRVSKVPVLQTKQNNFRNRLMNYIGRFKIIPKAEQLSRIELFRTFC